MKRRLAHNAPARLLVAMFETLAFSSYFAAVNMAQLAQHPKVALMIALGYLTSTLFRLVFC